MPYYLAPYIGAGSTDDPFRPLASDGQTGWSAVDLRHDGSVITGSCLLYLPIADNDNQLVSLGNGKNDTLSGAVKNNLTNKLGIDVTQVTNIDALVRELLLSDHSALICKRLRKRRGRFEILLGPEPWIIPEIAGGSSFTENWPTNGTTISSGQDQPWNEDSGDVTVVSNHLEAVTTGADAFGRCTSALAGDDHTISADCTTVASPVAQNSIIGLMARKIDSTTHTDYLMWTNRSSTIEKMRLLKVIAGSSTTLKETLQDVGSGSKRYQITAQGSSIRAWAGSLYLEVTDSEIVGNIRGGYFFNRNGSIAQSDLQLDNFVMQDDSAVIAVDYSKFPIEKLRPHARTGRR